MRAPFSFWKASSPPILYLPQVGIFSDLTPPLISSLSDLTLSNGTDNFYNTSRTNPLKVKNLHVTANSGLWADGTNGYDLFIWADSVTIDSGSAVGGTVPGLQYQNFTVTNGQSTALSGDGGSGGSGGGGGCSDNNGVGLPLAGGIGSSTGTNGGSGHTNGGGSPGLGGLGSTAAALAGSPWTPPVGGANGNGQASTQPGCGAGGNGGTVTIGLALSAGGGAGGSYVAIVCRKFLGVVANSGIYADAGAGGDDSLGNGFEGAGGGGGVIEVFACKYTGSLVPFVTGGFSNAGTNGADGTFRIYELNHAGTAITATHTVETDTWDHA